MSAFRADLDTQDAGSSTPPTPTSVPGSRPMPEPARRRCCATASCGCCCPASIPAASCASPSPRRRRPRCRTACSPSSRAGSASTMRRCVRAIARDFGRGAVDGTARRGASPLRARHRDARRPSRRHDPRVLHAPAAGLRLRGQCARALCRAGGRRSARADVAGAALRPLAGAFRREPRAVRGAVADRRARLGEGLRPSHRSGARLCGSGRRMRRANPISSQASGGICRSRSRSSPTRRGARSRARSGRRRKPRSRGALAPPGAREATRDQARAAELAKIRDARSRRAARRLCRIAPHQGRRKQKAAERKKASRAPLPATPIRRSRRPAGRGRASVEPHRPHQRARDARSQPRPAHARGSHQGAFRQAQIGAGGARFRRSDRVDAPIAGAGLRGFRALQARCRDRASSGRRGARHEF